MRPVTRTPRARFAGIPFAASLFFCVPALLAVSVTVEPASPCAAPTQALQFAATVSGTGNTAVSWYVDNVLNGNTAVGSISSNGWYTAPVAQGAHTVTAHSQASPSVTGRSTITVTSSPNCHIYPDSTSLPPHAQQTFVAPPVSGQKVWTVDNIPGGNSAIGTVNGSGTYIAPAAPGRHTVGLKNLSINSTSVANATVYSDIYANFGSRTDHSHPIPPYMFGAGRGESVRTVADRQLIVQGGVPVTRLYAQIQSVYATRTPNWSLIDRYIDPVLASGQRLILQMNYSPPWLQPNPNTCRQGAIYSAPTSISAWAGIAAAYVAHLESKYPGFVQDYEIWNEPDTLGMCAANHLQTYTALYAAAAPLMKRQAARYGKTIRVGGPALAGYYSGLTWLPALLSNSATAPYFDFVSYHDYPLGSGDVSDPWLSSSNGPSLYKATQDPNRGATAAYNKIFAAVKAGKQPLGARTPIYLTEFNTNWAFVKDCCKTNPTYAPLWNALYITDILNTAYSGLPAPGKMVFFAGNAFPTFCLIGTIDSAMDCSYLSGTKPRPYPAYYAYSLLSSATYLGLNNGGYMASSINPPTNASGVVITAFYNVNQDAIMIVNPTSNTYSQIKVNMQNVGFSTPRGTLYQIVHGSGISSAALPLTSNGGTFSAIVNIPPHSVQGISLKAQ